MTVGMQDEWAPSRKKVSIGLSLCHTKRRIAAPILLLALHRLFRIWLRLLTSDYIYLKDPILHVLRDLFAWWKDQMIKLGFELCCNKELFLIAMYRIAGAICFCDHLPNFKWKSIQWTDFCDLKTFLPFCSLNVHSERIWGM